MNRSERGYIFTPDDFQRFGSVGKYPLYQAVDNLAYVLDYEDHAIHVSTDSRQVIEEGQVGVILGANPCLAYVSMFGRNRVLLGHVPNVEKYDLDNFDRTEVGLAGGGRDNIREYRDRLQKNGFQIINPPFVADYEFALVVVRRNLPDVPRGIFYCYTSLE